MLLSALHLNVGAVVYWEVWNYPVWTFSRIATWGYLKHYIKLKRKEKIHSCWERWGPFCTEGIFNNILIGFSNRHNEAPVWSSQGKTDDATQTIGRWEEQRSKAEHETKYKQKAAKSCFILFHHIISEASQCQDHQCNWVSKLSNYGKKSSSDINVTLLFTIPSESGGTSQSIFGKTRHPLH